MNRSIDTHNETRIKRNNKRFTARAAADLAGEDNDEVLIGNRSPKRNITNAYSVNSLKKNPKYAVVRSALFNKNPIFDRMDVGMMSELDSQYSASN